MSDVMQEIGTAANAARHAGSATSCRGHWLPWMLVVAAAGCSPPPAPAAAPGPAPRYGAVMVEIGRRFELLGKAGRAHRWELAAFEAGELGEIFDEDLPRAAPPREPTGADLKALARGFDTNLGELRAATIRRDSWFFTESFAHAANTCNGCHRASGHAFIEVPGEAGETVPRLSRLPDRDAGEGPPASDHAE